MKKTTVLIEKIVQDNYYLFQRRIGNPNDTIIGEVFSDTDWNNIFDEPVLQFLSMDNGEVDQWFLTDEGFAKSERGVPFLTNDYGLPGQEEQDLFQTYVKEFLKENDKCPAEMFPNMPYSIIDIMEEMDYFKGYDSKALLEIYKLTGNSTYLPKGTQDFFFTEI